MLDSAIMEGGEVKINVLFSRIFNAVDFAHFATSICPGEATVGSGDFMSPVNITFGVIVTL
jgi:hypothetical protein